MTRKILSEGEGRDGGPMPLLAERAPWEGPRSTRAVGHRPAVSLK